MENSSNENFEKKERQLENLENLVENHTRTERHLEQYSHIGNKENAREKQDIREKQILELENKILGLDSNEIPEVQLENLKERYKSVEAYINNNRDKISQEDLKQLEEKQANRREQIANLEYKW